MMAVTCSEFNISLTWMYGDERVNYFVLNTACKCWGSLMLDVSRVNWHVTDNDNITVETVTEGLRFTRASLVKNEGEVNVGGGGSTYNWRSVYTRGRLSEIFKTSSVTTKRVEVDCPCLMAILDYLDDGDETDLMGAVDMLIDAGKFDPE